MGRGIRRFHLGAEQLDRVDPRRLRGSGQDLFGNAPGGQVGGPLRGRTMHDAIIAVIAGRDEGPLVSRIRWAYRAAMQKILVGFDDTEPAHRALHRALELARAFTASVVVASVAPLMVGVGRSVGPIDPTSDETEHERQLEVARSIVDTADGGQVVAAEYVEAAGDPVDTLVALAEEHDVDLIVLGTREPSLLARLFGQSVSSSVAAHTHRDVLIVHPGHDHDSHDGHDG
jgi:nucleotide-binding universal stress UspA family protein